jgi:predicted nucleic acid-binding Zn ribbon protein
MREVTHITLSFILALILFPFVGWQAALIVLVSGVLVDLDHILWYFVLFNEFNLKKCRDYCNDITEQKNKKALRNFLVIFHTLEFVALLVVLSLFFRWAFYILIGVALHLILDIYDRYRHFGTYEPYSVIVFFRK